MVYSRASACFAITIGHVDWKKSDLGNWLLIDDYAKRVAIGLEPYHPPLDSETGLPSTAGADGYHMHIFMETTEKYHLVDIRGHLDVFLGGEEYSVNVQACKSPKAWLIYLSKEDNCPFLFNVRVSELSLYARAWHHARTKYRYPQPITKCDDFIVSCGQNARFAIGIIEEHMNFLRKKKADERPLYTPNHQCELVNELLLLLENEGHVYVYGDPGLGKTEVIDWFLRGKNYWKCGEPSNFLFGTLPDKTDYIWFEDFKLDKYQQHLASLLSLMDKKEVTISRKGVDDTTKIIEAKFIFCSNYVIDELSFPMFKRRVQFIDIDHKMYNCEGCGRFETADGLDFVSEYLSD